MITHTKTFCYAEHTNGDVYKVAFSYESHIVLYGFSCAEFYSNIDRIIVREELI